MKILIIHPDSPNNRGDRAILAGSIKLIRSRWPEAEIWGFSENQLRDKKWMDINFLNIPVQSVNPVNMLRLLYWAKKCDLVLWGGGEILKDYTNKSALWYWIIKMYLVSLVNNNLYGFYQGIGPTGAGSSKKGIVFIVNRTKAFLVRDTESEQKLMDWGVKSTVVGSFDTAVMDSPEEVDEALLGKLKDYYDIDSDFLKNSVGFTPKAWFHYKHGGIIPYKYRRVFTPKAKETEDSKTLYQNIARLADYTIDKHDVNIVFFPMHLSKGEGDPGIAKRVVSMMRNHERTRIVDSDMLSPQEFVSVIAKCKAFVGVRLHSTILASLANVPAMVFYYVDKGRLFFEQIEMEHYSYPVEDLIKENKMKEFEEKIDSLIIHREDIKPALSHKIAKMRKSILKDFERYINYEE